MHISQSAFIQLKPALRLGLSEPPNIRFSEKIKSFSILSEDREFAGSGPWQTSSLAESWASVGNMEPEPGSLENSEDHSENHSCASDIINLEAELQEGVESDDDDVLQSSILSMREIEAHVSSPADSDLKPPQSMELLMCVEEPIVEEMEEEMAAEPVFTHTPLLSEPLDFTLASVPIPEIISQVLDHLPQSHSSDIEPNITASVSECHTASPSDEAVPKADSINTSAFELPVLLVGGAALVAVLGVLTYTLNRK